MSKLFRAVLFKFLFSRTTLTTPNMHTYHCHNTKHVHVPCHNTKHVHVPCHNAKHVHATCHNIKHVQVPLSQYKTCTHATVTTQNMYTYSCHNTKRVHVPQPRPQPQRETYTHTAVTIQNM